MKKIKFGLVLALFSLFAASCQKENLIRFFLWPHPLVHTWTSNPYQQ